MTQNKQIIKDLTPACAKPMLPAVVKSGIELSKGLLVYFIGEKAPMEVKAVNENFAICVRDLHRWYDADLLKYKVEMMAYMTFTEAYNDLKNEKIYTIIDFKRNIKAPHNLIFGDYDFKKQKSIDQLLKDVTSGKTELSERNKCNYNLDFERTLCQ